MKLYKTNIKAKQVDIFDLSESKITLMDDLSDGKSEMIQLQSKCPTDADMKAGELSC